MNSIAAFATAFAFAAAAGNVGQDHRASVVLTAEQEAKAQRLGKLVRCAVCQGLSAADSPADMAKTMMLKVRELVADGRTDDEVLQYFVDRYGEWVLLQPRAHGANWVVWVFPAFALLIGALIVGAYIRRHMPARAQALAADLAGPGASSRAAATDDADPYRKAIRSEVDS